jgi:hypothetical protein
MPCGRSAAVFYPLGQWTPHALRFTILPKESPGIPSGAQLLVGLGFPAPSVPPPRGARRLVNCLDAARRQVHGQADECIVMYSDVCG